LTFRRRV